MVIKTVLRRFGIWLSYLLLVVSGFVGFFFFIFPLNFTRVRGRRHIPLKRGNNVMFVSNHLSMYDSFLIEVAAYFPAGLLYPSGVPFNFAAEENYFRTWYLKIIFKLLRTVPVKKGRKDPFLMRKYSEFLRRNNILIFYQGGRSYDLKQIKSGPAYVIATTEEGPTVIPVYHEGIDRIFSRGGPRTRGTWRWLPRRFFRQPKVIFGPPVDFSDLRALPSIRQRIAAINRRIVERIEALRSEQSRPAV